MLVIYNILDTLLRALEILILIRIIMSWVVLFTKRSNGFLTFIYQVTEPMLKPFRIVLPLGQLGGMDFSPIILFFLIEILRGFLIRILLG